MEVFEYNVGVIKRKEMNGECINGNFVHTRRSFLKKSEKQNSSLGRDFGKRLSLPASAKSLITDALSGVFQKQFPATGFLYTIMAEIRKDFRFFCTYPEKKLESFRFSVCVPAGIFQAERGLAAAKKGENA